MLSEQTRAIIDALSQEELLTEMNLDQRSRFQNESYSYVKTRHSILENQERSAAQAQQRDIDHDSNQIAIDANKIAMEANSISAKAYSVAKWALSFSIIATLIGLFALIAQCSLRI